MANFLATDLDHLVGMIKHRLKVIQHHPGVIDGCLAITGLSINTTPLITNSYWVARLVDFPSDANGRDSFCLA
jgi:hypothetical protein